MSISVWEYSYDVDGNILTKINKAGWEIGGSVKESRGQPKSGALKQAVKNGNL